MKTLGRIWWHSILALMIAGAAMVAGTVIAEYAPHPWIESVGLIIMVGAVIAGPFVSFAALEYRAWLLRQPART